ncbi:MAG: hypothetical protein U5K69_26520 [Balneolaceae bacterium]|nr:hypothetical protein [Balneolaceae bacterium]
MNAEDWANMDIPEQGVGIIYFPGFEETIELNSDLISTIEIEPTNIVVT